MNVVKFVLTLIAAMSITSLFFSFLQYLVQMLSFILYALPLTGAIVLGFKVWKRTRP